MLPAVSSHTAQLDLKSSVGINLIHLESQLDPSQLPQMVSLFIFMSTKQMRETQHPDSPFTDDAAVQ